MWKIGKKVWEHLNGLMGRNMWVCGKMVNNTERAKSLTKMEKKQKGSGLMEKK